MMKHGGIGEEGARLDTPRPRPIPASGTALLWDTALWVVLASAGALGFWSALYPSVVLDLVLPFSCWR
ncbi:hypothetical protein NKH18_40235 [Streptomyces sp. M10(2022)]